MYVEKVKLRRYFPVNRFIRRETVLHRDISLSLRTYIHIYISVMRKYVEKLEGINHDQFISFDRASRERTRLVTPLHQT